MPSLTIEKTYADGSTPTSADFDNICDSLEVFLNVSKLGSDNLADNSITASSTFVAASITADKIQNLAVTTAKILDSAVTADKIATSAVTTAKILDSNVTTAKIAASAVTDAKVATGAVTAAKKASNVAGSAGTGVNSTGSATYSTAVSGSIVRPIIYTCGGGNMWLQSSTSRITPEGSIMLKKDSSVVMNQEFKYGPIIDDTGGCNINTYWPSSALFYIDTTENSSSVSASYSSGCDLTTGDLMSISGGNNITEIV